MITAPSIEIAKRAFISRLLRTPVYPPRSRDGRLRMLAADFEKQLGDCTDEILCPLEKFGFPRGARLSFSDFIREMTDR